MSRIFSKEEVVKCKKNINHASCFAKRFAAKEAFSKALGTGFSKGISFNEIVVLNEKNGKPFIKLLNKTKKIVTIELKKKRYKILLSIADEKEINIIANEVNLIESLSVLAGQLSHGQKQWLEIGMLLAQKPNLLLIDEPAAGMTAPERKKTVDLLKKLSKNQSVIVVEHDMEFVKSLECRVTVLHEGGVLAEGSLDYVSQNEKVIDVYLGR